MIDPEKRKNNKEEIPWEHYQKLYEKLDPEEVSLRCGVDYDEAAGGFLIRLMGKSYRVSHPDFVVTTEDAGFAALRDTYPAKILVARYLIEGRCTPFGGSYVTYRDVPWGELYFRNFQGRCLARLAFGFGSRLEEFSKALESIGGKRVKTGDAGYEFEFINHVNLQFILWSGDDEFPPSSQILFSDNITSAFTAEDMAVIGDVSIGTLKAMCDAGKKG